MDNLFDKKYWSFTKEQVFELLGSSGSGITESEAEQRIEQFGPNSLKAKKKRSVLIDFLSQFSSPIILILIAASIISFALHDSTDAFIIISIILVSGLLGFFQEHSASKALEKLLEIVQLKSKVLREGDEKEIPTEKIVPGDIIIISSGDIIPGDSYLLESNNLFLDEAALTGETFPVEKHEGKLDESTSLSQRMNTLYMGTHVVSGSGKAIVFLTGASTEFGKVSQKLKLRQSANEFERGIRRFGYLLMEITLTLTLLIFALNVYFHKPIIDSFLFSMALAVGLTPQLLPAIISINLSHGAKKMAKQKVIVKKLSSIENFGSMNILCSDKTGTLTEGKVKISDFLGINGTSNEKIPLFAYLNSKFQSGFVNPIDEAILNYKNYDVTDYRKISEIPYDFIRKSLTVSVSADSASYMITKGALINILDVCSKIELENQISMLDDNKKDIIENIYHQKSSEGLRVLGLAYKKLNDDEKPVESDMIFLGFILLYDPPKKGIKETIQSLVNLGIELKIITGDNRLVADAVGKQIGFNNSRIITGSQLRQMSDEALINSSAKINIFAEIEPNQKERIISSLKKAGNVVGYLGDGINDATAIYSADVGISVESAVDVAKEAADFVLLETDLNVLTKGVEEGRKTFANTMKYIFMATSANFGNMFSMAGASLFLPFLPLLPKQILLTNLLTDFPEMAIASDNVDAGLVSQPKKWNMSFIKKFMVVFGLISSCFDFLTFGVLLLFFKANEKQFQTGWFIESVVSATIIVLVVRTRKSFFSSLPGKNLLIATIGVILFTVMIPLSPFISLFGFEHLPVELIASVAAIIFLYILTAEIAKRIFYKHVNY